MKHWKTDDCKMISSHWNRASSISICLDYTVNVCSPFQSNRSSSRISTLWSGNFGCSGVVSSRDSGGDKWSIRVSSEENDRVGEKAGENVESVEVLSMQRKSCEYAHCSSLTVSAAGKGYMLEAHLYMRKEWYGNGKEETVARSIGWWNQICRWEV